MVSLYTLLNAESLRLTGLLVGLFLAGRLSATWRPSLHNWIAKLFCFKHLVRENLHPTMLRLLRSARPKVTCLAG